MKKSRPKSMPSSSGNIRDVMQRPWTPFVRCEPDKRSPHILTVCNSRYLVLMRRNPPGDDGPDVIHLSIKRLDQRPHIGYRGLMRIKDELYGENYEAVQLFPAREREVELANQYHLWLRGDSTYRFPFGFTERLVSDVSVDGVHQEPWPPNERPADCLSAEEVQALMQRESMPQIDNGRHPSP
ncbi:MAG TPA: hypothetical protein VFV38_26615 [Ktedonobacteraceae bacterium]|nr:hypothetical protein [Ktedonobacteraceae bacterium]